MFRPIQRKASKKKSGQNTSIQRWLYDWSEQRHFAEYVEYITNIRMQAVGLGTAYPDATSNPIPWINAWLSSDNVQVAPQEAEISSLVGQIDNEVKADDFEGFELVMPTIKINKLTSIESNPPNTLLETMEQAGLEPEYNCRDGHCGRLVVARWIPVKLSTLVLLWLTHKAMKFCHASAKLKTDLSLSNVIHRSKKKRA